MKVFLIGLPGSGKSTLGRAVAHLLRRPFVDLDGEIVKGEGKSVHQIFGSLGEAPFRKIEKHYLEKWCARPGPFIMATGGGAPCHFNNMELINETGTSIFLDVPPEVIALRMLGMELAKRPLFAGQDATTIQGRVQKMREERLPYYAQARIVLSGERLTAQAIAEEVLALEA